MRELFELIAGPVEPERLGSFFFLCARLLPLTLLAPFLRVRGASWLLVPALVVGLGLGLWPSTLGVAPVVPDTGAALARAVLSELGVGLVSAFILALPFWALGWAGELWSRWGGAWPEREQEPVPAPLAELSGWLAVLVFLAADGPAALLHGLAEGLRTWPLGATPRLWSEPAALLSASRAVGLGLSLALSVTLPFALVSWLLEAVLGVLQRGLVGLPVAALSAPLRPLLLLGTVLLSSALLLSRLPAVFREALLAARRLWS